MLTEETNIILTIAVSVIVILIALAIVIKIVKIRVFNFRLRCIGLEFNGSRETEVTNVNQSEECRSDYKAYRAGLQNLPDRDSKTSEQLTQLIQNTQLSSKEASER